MNKKEEIDFWPGYVDALMNLVLNLLFLSAIFAIAIFVLGMESSRLRIFNSENKEKEAISMSKTNEEHKQHIVAFSNFTNNTASNEIAVKKASTSNVLLSNDISTKLSEPSSQLLVINVNTKTEQKENVVIDKITIKNEKEHLISVFYPKDIISINIDVKNEIKKILSENQLNNKRIIIWGVASLSSAASNRLAYLRIMEIRNILLENKIKNNNISIHIYGGKVGSDGGKVYILWDK